MSTSAQMNRMITLSRKDLLRLRQWRYNPPLTTPSLSWISLSAALLWTILTTALLIYSTSQKRVEANSYFVTILHSQPIPVSSEDIQQEEAESPKNLLAASTKNTVRSEKKTIADMPEPQLEFTSVIPPLTIINPVVAQTPETSTIQSSNLQSNYWSKVYTAITKNIRYPMAAKMQRIEGHVSVQISINSEGNLLDVIEQEASGHMFYSAVLAAAHRAAPYPPPPEQLQNPVIIEISVAFLLDSSSISGHNF